MGFKKCPGQDFSQKKREEIVCDLPCPSCGFMVEFFFDDKTRICPQCGNKVAKDDLRLLEDFGCALWCESAEKCLGSGPFRRLMKAKKKKNSL